MKLSGKAALVTGGTDGIGFEIARQLRAKGAVVVVCGRRAEQLAVARGEGFDAIQADLSSADGCARLIADYGARPLDLLVNNAGASPPYDVLGEVDLEGTDQTIFLNLNAPLHLMAGFIDKLRAAKGTVVNVTSGLAIAPRAGGPVYCATKAGLRSATQAIRATLKPVGVHVVEALPPVVETAMTAARSGAKMPARECARQIVAGIEHDRDEINVGQVKLLQTVHSISPALARRIMLRF